jgi:hypothetical protein
MSNIECQKKKEYFDNDDWGFIKLMIILQTQGV